MKTNLLKSIFISLILLVGATHAWAYNQSAVDLYFDNSEAKWNSCYVYIGHGTWTSCYPLTRVSGTQYLWKLAKADFNGGGSWNGATGWVLCYEKWWDSKGESIDKYTWHGAKNVTKKRTSAWSASYIYKTNGTVSVTSDGNTINAYNTTTVSKKDYTVTINTATGGTLTVKDYDNNAVASGASKIHLTVLKFSATPADGYVLDEVQINNGSTTTTIAAADLATKTHTLTSAVTITPVWRATVSTVTVTATATNGTVTGGGVVEEGTSVTLTATPNAGYQFVNWTVGGAEVSTANPYTFTAEEDVTVVANFEETPKTTIYFVNNKNWSKVNVYGWEGSKGENPGWPGADITANTTGEKIGEFDVYSYTVEVGSYKKIIFNDGSAQTADFLWTDGKYYYMGAAANYAGGTKEDVTTAVAPDPLATDVYLAGEMNSWSTTANEFRKATGEATTASVTVNLTAGTHQFKLVINGAWKGNNGTMQRGDDSVHEGGWSFDDDGNCQIVADVAGDYTFTWNLDTKKLTVAYPALPKFTVSATATNGTVNGTGEYEQGATATLTAIPNDGYLFINWTKGVEVVATTQEYSFIVNEDVTLVANFEKAQEETHNVTVSYMCGMTSIKAATTPSVGVETPVSITAPDIEGYTFQSWTIGDGIKTDNANTANPISIKTKATGPYTLTANYTENPCVYFVNTARWTTVNIYAWASSDDQNKNGNWPGKAMTKETEKISGYDVYKYVMPAGKNFDKIIFNNKVGENGEQTGDLEWINGKYYVYSAGQWVDKSEVADLLPKPVIYFKNNPKWKEVYVYFHTGDYWNDADNGGSGAKGLTEANGRVCKMEKVGETDIYKYDYEASGIVPGNVIAFTEAKQPDYDHFHKTQAVYRTDYNPNMELFIPQATYVTKNETKYFNKGLWMKYNSMESGYTITGSMNSWNQDDDKFTSSSHTGYHFDIELSLGGGQTYEFQVKNIKNDWYGKQNTKITATKADLELGISAGDTYNVKLTTTSAGNYIFSIDLSEGKMMVSVEYPLQVNDYRMVYIESDTKGTKPYTKFHPAQSIRYQATGEKKDTVSFYINKTAGKNPSILLQKCTAISGANFTWEDVAIQYINGNGGADPALALAPARKTASITYGDGCTAVTGNGVYNFVMQQTDGSAAFVTEATHPYTGNYYIRTDGAEGGWRKYLTNPDNIMTHSETALTHGKYDYYFCEWMLQGDNVKYVVANDYSYCVSDTLAKDDIVTNENGNLPADANVRYTWNSSTNALKRAYINGSGKAQDRYLVLEGNAELQDALGNAFPEGTGERTGLKANETTFADMGNWLYQVDVKASEATLVKLTANYNGTIQYFKGNAESSVKIITGATNHYKFRLIYDFKTNYLLCGLIEDGNINETITVDEAMISRSHHNQAQTFQVASGKSITTIKTVYGVMNFKKTTLNDGSKSQYERALYWVSFPFDVDLGKAFGFGNYGEHWIMEYYDGEARAKNGWWVDSDTYWEYIWDPKGCTLEAGKGYVLCLDLDLLKESASLWKNTDDIALYFPSKDDSITINDKPALKDTDVEPLTCTIERDDRKTKDSNWNIIGVPSYANISDFSTKIKDVEFYYQYNAADNSYKSQESTTFNTMHAYMVQFAGKIQWAYKTVVPAQMAARKQSVGKDQYTLRLALQQEGTDHDHTFIRLQEDNATAEFDMNYDLCKIINRGANIYSMIGNVEVAANVLPVEERVIPLGLDIEEDGNYTFAMPDGTDGITAILIDYETGKETNLLLADYTVELNAGIDNERFALRLRPSYVATEVENTILTDGNDNVKKYIIDGALYLLRDGKLYDAQGRMIQQ